MGSSLGRMLAITLPLAGIGIAAPFLAPALLGAGAAGGVAGGAATGGAIGGGAGATTAAAAPAITAATPAVASAAPAAAAGGAGSSITPAALASGIQGGASLSSGLLNQALNSPTSPTLPTIRAAAQTAAPYFSTDALPSVAGAGLTSTVPGPGPTNYQGSGVAGNLGNQIALNLLGGGGGAPPDFTQSPDPFAQYSIAA